MFEPFINNLNGDKQLWTGEKSDMVPFLTVRHEEGKVVFQVPGGRSLEVSPSLAIEFSQNISAVILMALEHEIESHKHHWAIKVETVDRVDCISGMYCTECDKFLSWDEIEDLLNK